MQIVELLRHRTRLVDTVRVALLFSASYFLLNEVSFIYPLQELNITPWDPQPALAVALLFLRGRFWLPWAFATVFFTEFFIRDLPVSVPTKLLLAALLTCGYAVIAGALRRTLEISPDLATRKDVISMAVAVVLGAGAVGTVYVGALSLCELLPVQLYPSALFRFWLGNSIGMLVILPLLFFLADPTRRYELWALMRNREAAMPFALVIGVLAVVFLRDEAEQYKLFYLLFLPIIWIAARHGLAAALVAVAIIQAGVIVSVVSSDREIFEVLELQTLLLCLVFTGLVLGVAVDEWRVASQRLARAQQLTLVGEMATALAHELNQPLTALSTYADAIRLLAASNAELGAPLVETAERIRRVARRSADTVARFRRMAPNRPPQLHRTSIIEPLRRAIDNLHERTERAGVLVELKFPDDLPAVTVDQERIDFVFLNLIGNALDAMQAQPEAPATLRIDLKRDGRNHVLLTLRDSGPGVPLAMIENIFEPFQSGKAQGMGLGLAISRSIVESHGGRLWAEPGSGGIFHLRLPL